MLTHQLQREFSSLSTFDLLSFSKATSGTEWTFSPKQHLLFSGCQYVIVKPLLVASSLSLISSATRVSLGNDISKPRAQNHLITQLSSQKRTYMVRNWPQQFQIRIALHFFRILTGSRSFSRKLDLIWNWSGNFGKKSVQFQFIWYASFLRISSPKSGQVLLFDIQKAFASSFFCIDTVFVGWHWQYNWHDTIKE